MSTFTIPTIFTAVDKFSSVMRRMTQSNNQFNSSLQQGSTFGDRFAAFNARNERGMRRMLPGFGAATEQLTSFASAAVLAGAAIGGISFAFNAIKEYDAQLAELRAITGATGSQFDVFKKQIESVATAQGKSANEVAKAFTTIGNAQPDLLKDAAGLSAVTNATLMLAKASRMELEPTATALTTIMNQFGLGAVDAARSVDILAAGSVAGSSEISDTAESLQKFGTVAAGMGVKLDESVALVELGSKFQKGAEAGDKFRNMLINMGAIKALDKKAIDDLKRLGVNFDIVENKALPLNVRLKEMAKISKDSTAIFHVFGKENQAMATGILNNVDKFDAMTKAVNTTGETARMAAENQNTMSGAMDRMKAAAENFFTVGVKGNVVLEVMSSIFNFLGKNMNTVLSVVLLYVGALVAMKVATMLSSAALVAYNVILGVTTALHGGSALALVGNTVAYNAFRVAVVASSMAMKVATAAQWLFNAAIMANPIVLITVAIIGLIAWLLKLSGGWDLIKKGFTDGGIIGGIKSIGIAIFDLILLPVQQLLSLLAKIPGLGIAEGLANDLAKFRADLGLTEGITFTNNNNMLPAGGGVLKPAFNPMKAQQDALTQRLEKTERSEATLTVVAPKGTVDWKADKNFPIITSTMRGM